MPNLYGFFKRSVRLLNQLPPGSRVNFTHLQPRYKGVYFPQSIDKIVHPERWESSISGVHDIVSKRLNTFATCAANALKYNYRYKPAEINLVAFAEFDMRSPGFSGAFPVDIFSQSDPFLEHARTDVNSNPVAFEQVVVQTIARRVDHYIQQLTSPEERRCAAVLVPIPIGLSTQPEHVSFSPIPVTPIVNICVVIIYDNDGALHSYSFTSKQTVSPIDYPDRLHSPIIQRILYSGLSSKSFEFVPVTARSLKWNQVRGVGVPAWEMPGTGFADLKYDPHNPARLGQPIIPVPWVIPSIMLQICMDYGNRVMEENYADVTAPISVVVGHGIPDRGYAGIDEKGILWKVEGQAGELIPPGTHSSFASVGRSSLELGSGKGKKRDAGTISEMQRVINLKDSKTVKPRASLDTEIQSAISSTFTYEVPK